ncbi:MAG TPA: protein phosphatase 2C domain-containing protein [Actinospica sp.]|jgi:serine/threonine protein phosphatase PrpC|nr:protein phosphatase 2C domain-containing protein [Actinospica sp.]
MLEDEISEPGEDGAPTRPVLDLTSQDPEETPAEPAPPVIAEPLVLVGHPSNAAAPCPLPAMAESVPDTVVDGGTVGGLVARAVSIRGEDHRTFKVVRQDSVALWTMERKQSTSVGGPILLATVADGVGSCAHSHVGSAAACRLARQHVTTRLKALLATEPTTALTNACRATTSDIAAGLRVVAAERGEAPEQFSTTLVAALVVPGTDEHPARAVVFSVGDSTAAVLRDGVWLSCLASEPKPESSEIMSTRTDALPAHADRVEATVVTLERGDVLLLCTDGLGNPMVNGSVRDQLAEWWGAGRVPSLPEFHWQLSFRAQSYSDDRSAVCVWVP